VSSDSVSAVVAGIVGSIRCVLPLLQGNEFLELKLSIFGNSLGLIGRFPLYTRSSSVPILMHNSQNSPNFGMKILLCNLCLLCPQNSYTNLSWYSAKNR